MKKFLAVSSMALLAACVATPSAVQPGMFEPDTGFTVSLEEAWSYFPPNFNQATVGGYLTRDGFYLNRVHLITLEDGDSMIAGKGGDIERPYFHAGMTELEIVEMVTNSLTAIGYTTMEADEIRPAMVDGQPGMAFTLQGKWENGANIKGDVLAVPVGSDLHMMMFLAPELHYYEALQDSVEAMMASMNLPGTGSVS